MLPSQAKTPVRAALDAIATSLQLHVEFSPEVLAEADALVKSPGIDDPTLEDFTALPFVTIDAATSKDLDQALCIAREGAGFLVAYAIADASHYVKPGSALFAEAMKRGSSFYFPGFSIPMLPRTLSEGIVSLNPDGPRRALVFLHHLAADGALSGTELKRGRVRSLAKLAWGDVQALIDHPETSPLKGRDFEASLFLLRDVGRLRLALAENRGLVRYRREEVEVNIAGEGLAFAVMEEVRDEVELWNEQLSLMCNAEGGRLLHEHPSPAVQPVYRTQGGPEEARLEGLARLTASLARVCQLPETPWVWRRDTTALSAWLKALPQAKKGSREDRLARAISRQAVMVNLRSEYTTEAGPHVGVGAEPYARFSAPMRELVGVFLHKEAVELLTGVHPPAEQDELLRAEVVKVANRSRETQRKVQDLSNQVVLDRSFSPELERPFAKRTRYSGTVTGFTTSKVHVRLDAPPLDVKLYLRDLSRFYKGAWLEVAEDGAVLRVKDAGPVVMTLGDAVTLVVSQYDEKNQRWCFAPEPKP